MSKCPLSELCGGCLYSVQDQAEYQIEKYARFKKIIDAINQPQIKYGEPVFIPAGTRRRATMAFSYVKKQLRLGFNVRQSHDIADCQECALLTPGINAALPQLRRMLSDLCAEPYSVRKGKKTIRQGITEGDISVCEADNGLDITLELPFEPELNHRMILSEFAASADNIIRISWRRSADSRPETILEKVRPVIHNHGVDVYIPAGTFLQASKAGENALIGLVLKYLGGKSGRIADLFCGVGTFSYPLAQDKNNKIWSLDSSAELLDGFRQSVNKNMLPNIKAEARNLFKYPLDETELKNIDVIVFDPPRAGAAAQVAKLAAAQNKPEIVIAVSCNPHTFVNDANTLIEGGYTLEEITFVDQFIYSGHTELVALFKKVSV